MPRTHSIDVLRSACSAQPTGCLSHEPEVLLGHVCLVHPVCIHLGSVAPSEAHHLRGEIERIGGAFPQLFSPTPSTTTHQFPALPKVTPFSFTTSSGSQQSSRSSPECARSVTTWLHRRAGKGSAFRRDLKAK